jgi:hypothetical protein
MFRLRQLRDRAAGWHAQRQYEPGATAYLALMNALLLDNAAAGALFREFARRDDVPTDLAAEALLLAHSLDPLTDPGAISKVRIEHTVPEPEPLMERLLSDRHFRKLDTELQADPDSNEPPPRAVFEIFDKPNQLERPTSIAELPELLGVALVYGRQTDREARLVVSLSDDSSGENQRRLNELVGDLLQTEPQREEFAKVSPLDEIGPRISTSDIKDTLAAQKLGEEFVDFTVREHWPQRPHPLLGGKTPTEAANDPALKTGLLAALIHLEITPPFDVWKGSYQEYWKRFGLEHDVQSWSPRSSAIIWLTRINANQLDDGILWSAAVYAAAMGVRRACNELGRALLARPSLRERDELGELLRVLVESSAPTEVRLDLLQGAIEWCEQKKVSAGMFRVREFVCHVMLHHSKEASETLGTITSRHSNEQDTMQLLFQTLHEMGLVGPDGQPISSARESPQPQEAEAPASALWTPDQPAAAQTAKPGKLWLPGMD